LRKLSKDHRSLSEVQQSAGNDYLSTRLFIESERLDHITDLI
jgi:hypothetical protein